MLTVLNSEFFFPGDFNYVAIQKIERLRIPILISLLKSLVCFDAVFIERRFHVLFTH